jgi:hypothetical protein
MKQVVWLVILLVAVALSAAAVIVTLPKQSTMPVAPSFSVNANPVSVFQGDQAKVNVTILSENNFDALVVLSVSGLPPGMVSLWNPQIVTPPRNGWVVAQLTLDVPISLSAQTYNLTISASGGGISKTASLRLTVLQLPPSQIFGLTVNPPSLRIDQGQSGYTNVTVVSSYGFSSPVALTVSNADEVNGTFPNNATTISVTPPANGNSTVLLTISVTNAAAPGSYTLTVTATNNTFTRTRNIQLTVPPSPVTLYLSAWTGGWNSSIPLGQPACSPSGTPTCNPGVTVFVEQQFNVTIESFDDPHNIAYYPGGYPSESVTPPFPFPGNPDALNRSEPVTNGTTTSLVHSFSVAGTYEYYCEFHSSGMHGQITVQALGAVPSLNKVLDERGEGAEELRLPILFSTSGVISVSLGVGSVKRTRLTFLRDKGWSFPMFVEALRPGCPGVVRVGT